MTLSSSLRAQSFVHTQSSTYQPPRDAQVAEHLRQWQDLKFGILLHWGVYSVAGICESWTITSEDWITPDTTRTYEEYKQWYWGLSSQFCPTRFNPGQWAQVAHDAGMRYAIFTTKHHDGFCLWDSRQTDYTVAHSGFAGNEKADVARYVFDAFRQQDMMTGAYFSKPDWHSPYYWWPSRATYDRMHNYSISKYPERWRMYQDFVYNQVSELMHDYGKLDILWLDGGWCTAPHEDIRLGRIVQMARQAQPGLIVVERSCPGEFEDYQTPEQRIPDTQVRTPWESCITLTDDWGWTDHPRFKTPQRIIATLAEVVAKGGSLLLGVGPTPDGLIEEGAVSRLHTIGQWMRANGEAIYATCCTDTYRDASGQVWFTASKDARHLYAIIPEPENESQPSQVTWQGNIPRRGSKVRDLATGKAVRWSTDGTTVTVQLPLHPLGTALKIEL